MKASVGEGVGEVDEEGRGRLVGDQLHAGAGVTMRVDEVRQGCFQAGDPVGQVCAPDCFVIRVSRQSVGHDEDDRHWSVQRVRQFRRNEVDPRSVS